MYLYLYFNFMMLVIGISYNTSFDLNIMYDKLLKILVFSNINDGISKLLNIFDANGMLNARTPIPK